MSSQQNQFEIETAIQEAYRLMGVGKINDAIAIGNQLIKKQRNDPRSWNLLCEINRERGAMENAVHCASQAANLSPSIPNYHLQLARCLAMAERRAESLKALERVLLLDPQQPVLLDAIGSVYTLIDEQSRALPFYERAVVLEPEKASFVYNLAACQRMNGDIAAAERSCERVIALDPRNYEAYYVRADLRKWTQEVNHVEQLKALLDDSPKNRRGEIFLQFALAKELEDMGEYENSFEHRRVACELQRTSMRYDISDDVETIDYLIQKHTSEALHISLSEAPTACVCDEPIFVMGLPRSGTTLVERILSSHSMVYSAGELNEFSYALLKLANNSPRQQTLSKRQLIEKSLELDMEQLGERYIQSTRPRTGHTPFFVDKLPLNYLYCGLIHASMPNAKMILLQRGAMDVCYAMYKNLFTLPYPFSYDLDDLGQYYLAYRRLVDHWRSLLGNRLFVVGYEDIVHNQETMTRRILDYCGLPWEATCLEFYKNNAASSTASAVQVRQPIYSSSIGRWREYEQQLQPLVAMFEKNGIEID